MSSLGATVAPEEPAARKLLAMFDWAMPRDSFDLYRLAQRWNGDELMSLAETSIRVSTSRRSR